MISLRAARQRLLPGVRQVDAAPVGRDSASAGVAVPAARWASVLLGAISVAALSDILVADHHGARLQNQLLFGALGLALGLAVRQVDWRHWHQHVLTGLVVVAAYALIGMLAIYGSLSPSAHVGLFIVVSAWIGVFHPPGTALILAPVTAAAYLLPQLLVAPGIDLRSALAVVPISFLISELIARSVESAEVARRRLAELAIRDPLTSLHNRRYFDDVLQQLFATRGRISPARRTAIAAIVFDLDHFGEFNRLHGHEAGDVVLQRFAAILASQFRAGDLVARVGGEEFSVVLPGANGSDAALAADRVRCLVEETAVLLPGGEALRVTVSAGCSATSDEVTDPGALLGNADVALNMAKRAGRNQVVSA